MIVIADSGSTKTTWCFLNENSKPVFIETEGYNPYFVNAGYIEESLQLHFKNIPGKENVTEVYFYGSGCFPETYSVIKKGVGTIFPQAELSVEMDLLAAARSLLGFTAGFAAILGTGTNTCVYDGTNIIHNIDSLGYILGDEGSGTSLGKKLIGDYIRGYMPGDISLLFYDTYKLDKEQIFQQVYSNSFSNRFCGSFSTFIHQHISHPYISQLTETAFRQFFNNLVIHYPGYKNYTFNCVGSIGFYFADQLKKVALEFEMQPGVFVKSPMEGLIDYHSSLKKSVNQLQ